MTTSKPGSGKIVLIITSMMILGLGIIFSLYLSKQLQGVIIKERIKTVPDILSIHALEHLGNGSVLENWQTAESQSALNALGTELSSIQEVVNINIYDLEGVLVWSEMVKEDIGRKHESDDVLDAIQEGTKIEEAEPEIVKSLGLGRALEIYQPIKLADGRTIGVVELYFDESYAINMIHQAQYAIFEAVFFVIIMIVSLLTHAYSRQNQLISAQAKEIQTIIENAPVGIAVVDRDQTITAINAKMIEISNAKNEDVQIGGKIVKLPIINGPGVKEAIDLGFAGKETETETSFPSDKKSTRFLHVFSVPLVDEKKQVDRVIMLVEDLTERKLIEDELQKHATDLKKEVETRTKHLNDLKEQYRTVAEGLPIGVFVLQNNVVKFVNSSLLAILGLKDQKEVIERDWKALFPSKTAPTSPQNQACYTLRTTKKNGAVIDLEIISSPGSFNGEPATIGSLQDITARNAIERRLKENEERFRTLFNSLPVCIKVFDTSGKLLSVNSYGKQEHFWENLDDKAISEKNWWEIIDPTYKKQLDSALSEASEGKISGLELRHQPGTSRNEYCYTTFAPIRGQNGKISYILGYSTDLTEQKKSKIRAKELDLLRNRFIQIVSHQLRTPLNSARWNLEVLLAEELGKMKKEQKEFIRLTYEANVEVVRRIHDLLTTMDIQEQRIFVNRNDVSLESLLGSVLIDFKKKCLVKNIAFEYAPPETPLPTTQVDAEKIRDVFDKILDNAVTYTPAKGRIKAKFINLEDKIRFEISDSGIGIPKTEHSRIFSQFYRASNAASARPDASGLGLYIAKYFVETHCGKICFESEEGTCATFWFELPT